MEKGISKSIGSDLIKLGLYQIIGGAVGALVIIWSILKTPLLTGLTVLAYLFILLFFAYSIFCGIQCLTTKRNALRHSLINQILQVASFAILGFAFNYVAGIYLTVGLDLSHAFNFKMGIGISQFDFKFNSVSDRIEVDLNLVAFALIYWIDKMMKRVKEEIALRQVASMGED